MNSYKNYINLIRNIMNFDKKFDDVIIRIIPKIFDEYYLNRCNKIYNIDNIFKKYDLHRYQLLKKKYNVTQSDKLIFRFRKHNTLEYTIKLLKQNVHVHLEQGETYKSVGQDILKTPNIQCYAKFINEKYKNKYTLDAPIILQNSKVHMYNYLYEIYSKLFGDDYKVLYIDTDSIYSKSNMAHER